MTKRQEVKLSVGMVDSHALSHEIIAHAPRDIEFKYLTKFRRRLKFFNSPIVNYFRDYELEGTPLLKSAIAPLYTRHPWVFSLACLQEATVFQFLKLPIPRGIRLRIIKHILGASNCRKIMFWSHAGLRTMHTYGGFAEADPLLKKSTVVYPAIRTVDDRFIRFQSGPCTLLFTGEFFRKGGANVVDVFAKLQPHFPGSRLLICADEQIDFNTPNAPMRAEYLEKIRTTPGIEWLGRVPRARLLEEILPRADIYLLPTYNEAFGFSIIEAMAYGIPVIATNHFAIPEMIEHEQSGYLIDTSRFDADRLFKGYIVNDIPADFRQTVDSQLETYLAKLMADATLREHLGRAALGVARDQFSFDRRNRIMTAIYRDAIQAD